MALNLPKHERDIKNAPHKSDVFFFHNYNTSTQETEAEGSRVENHVIRPYLKQVIKKKDQMTEIFQFHLIYWDHRGTCGLSLTKALSCDASTSYASSFPFLTC